MISSQRAVGRMSPGLESLGSDTVPLSPVFISWVCCSGVRFVMLVCFLSFSGLRLRILSGHFLVFRNGLMGLNGFVSTLYLLDYILFYLA